MTAPRSRIQQKNREAILDAALEVFSAHGFRGATLDQIAEGAGLSKPNLLALISYTAWGNALFGTAPLPLEVWLFLLPWAAGMLAIEEARKWFVRRRSG